MAGDTEQLVVSLEARVTAFERAFARANQTASRNWSAIERRGQQAARNLEGSFSRAGAGVASAVGRMASVAAGAIAAAAAASQLKEYADAWTGMKNKLIAAGESTSDVAKRQDELAAMAIRSRSSLESVGDLYSNLTSSTKELGANQAQVSRVVETISKAFSMSGVSAAAASGAITQLGQAFASGVLRGDELNSVLEGAPPLARLIAREFGVSVGELKKLGKEGKISADKVFQAILNGSKDIDASFAKTNSTIAQSFENLSTAMTAFIGRIDQTLGLSNAIASGLNFLATNMQTVGSVALVLGSALLGFAVGGPIGAGVAALASSFALFGAEIRPIAGELATLGDYARVAFEMTGELATDAAKAIREQFARAADYVTEALGSINAEQAFSSVLAAVKAVNNATIGAFVFAGKAILAAWENLGAGLAEVMVNAMNSVISTIEGAINKVVSAVNSVLSTVNSGASAVGAPTIPTLGNVSLGRVSNAYAGAGEKAGKAFSDAFNSAFSTDYIGDGLNALAKGAKAAVQPVRDRANALAESRAEIERRRQQDQFGKNSLTAPLKPPVQAKDGGKGGGGGAGSENEFSRLVQQLQQQTAAYDRQRQALSMTNAEAIRFETTAKLLNAAQQAGIPVNDQLKAKIDGLANAYANASVKLQEAEQAQQEFRSAAQQIGSGLADGLTDAIVEGKKLSEVLKDLAKQLLRMALNKIMMSLLGGVFGFKDGGTVPGFASGGFVSGPGTSRSDSVPALLSNGEFVVNAAATKRYGALLEAINSGRSIRLADGGPVGGAVTVPRASAAAGAQQVITLAPSITVNANGGQPEQNQDLASKIGQQVQHQLRGLIVGELRQQLRPGGLLKR